MTTTIAHASSDRWDHFPAADSPARRDRTSGPRPATVAFLAHLIAIEELRGQVDESVVGLRDDIAQMNVSQIAAVSVALTKLRLRLQTLATREPSP